MGFLSGFGFRGVYCRVEFRGLRVWGSGLRLLGFSPLRGSARIHRQKCKDLGFICIPIGSIVVPFWDYLVGS